MKRRLATLAAAGALVLTATACQDWLDVNTNPNGPETVAAPNYLPPMLHWMATGELFDGRCTGQFTQAFAQTTRSTNTLMARNFSTADPCAQQWRDIYWSFGQNLIDMMEIAQREERWDILGAGYVLKAWGWQELTDLHGEIIVKDAFDPTLTSFHYDQQEFVYGEVRRLLDSAIVYLSRTDGAVDASYMGRGDKMYNGDRTKWLKLAHGVYARNLNHYSNKTSYDPAKVVEHVALSFASNADDGLWSYPNTQNDDRNWQGPTRNNYSTYRPTQFMVALLDGTRFGVRDPRLSRMLAPAPDSVYRGLDVQVANPVAGFTAAQTPMMPYRYVVAPPAGSPGLYMFADKVRKPVMTYAELQFIRAEALYRSGNLSGARDAYRNAISAHIDFVNERNRDDNQLTTQISATEKSAFLADTRIVPTDPNALSLQKIMSQKFIALAFWGYNEQWMDMRRYHYQDNDPRTGERIYPGYEFPTTLASENAGKPIYRLLPRYNSEFVWNQAGLNEIGGLALDYHTKQPWITTPGN